MTGRPHFLDGLPDRWTDTPCREHPDRFMDAARSLPPKEAVEDAKLLCAGCPIRTACRDHAINNGERDGIWGGLTPGERDAHARSLTPDTATEDIPA